MVPFTGAATGNYALIVATWAVSSSPPVGWSAIDYYLISSSYNMAIYGKTLTAADILAGSVTVGGLGSDAIVTALFYSGPTSAGAGSSVVSTSTNLTIPGFTKAPATTALVLYAARLDPTIITAPGLSVVRAPLYANSTWDAIASDILNPATYVDGTNLIFPTNSTYVGCAGAIELKA